MRRKPISPTRLSCSQELSWGGKKKPNPETFAQVHFPLKVLVSGSPSCPELGMDSAPNGTERGAASRPKGNSAQRRGLSAHRGERARGPRGAGRRARRKPDRTPEAAAGALPRGNSWDLTPSSGSLGVAPRRSAPSRRFADRADSDSRRRRLRPAAAPLSPQQQERSRAGLRRARKFL